MLRTGVGAAEKNSAASDRRGETLASEAGLPAVSPDRICGPDRLRKWSRVAGLCLWREETRLRVEAPGPPGRLSGLVILGLGRRTHLQPGEKTIETHRVSNDVVRGPGNSRRPSRCWRARTLCDDRSSTRARTRGAREGWRVHQLRGTYTSINASHSTTIRTFSQKAG
jgi:hypothetical protein